MKCMILSRNQSLYTTKRLAEEGRKLGFKIRICDTLRLSVSLSQEKQEIWYKNDPIKHPDIIIPRIGASITSFGGCILFQLEKMNIPVLNQSNGMFNSRDKFRCGQILASHGLPIPRTLMLRRPSQKDLNTQDPSERKILFKTKVQKAIDSIGGAPVVIKLNKGTQGIGVVLALTLNDIYAQIDMLWKRKEDFIIQEFIQESKGIDIRALVVNNQVVASMKRESATGDFRSNTHQGGEVSAFTLPKEAQDMAVEASRVVGLRVAGVDMLLTKDFKIIEINSSPGFEGLEKATEKNIAKEIMKEAYRLGKNYKKEKEINIINKIQNGVNHDVIQKIEITEMDSN